MHVVADRIVRDETFVKGKSYCEFCKHPLSFFDLLPIISFLYLRGKCRYCGKKLSWYYPISELVTAFVFAINTVVIGIASPILLLITLFIVSCFLIILFADIKYGIIPDKIVYPLFVGILIFRLLTGVHTLLPYVFSALGAGIFFLLLFLITKGRGMGFGDVKYAVVMGLFLGFPGIIYGLYIAFLTGAFVSFILILWKRKKIKSTIPFGPFLVFGTLSVFFFPQFIEKIVNMVLP